MVIVFSSFLRRRVPEFDDPPLSVVNKVSKKVSKGTFETPTPAILSSLLDEGGGVAAEVVTGAIVLLLVVVLSDIVRLVGAVVKPDESMLGAGVAVGPKVDGVREGDAVVVGTAVGWKFP
jgi:hypothetical protein